MKTIKFLIAVFFISNILFAQDNYKSSMEFEKLADKNYLSRNYDLFLVNMKKADELRPNHPRILYNLAAAYSLTNDKKDALNELQKLINMKLFYPVEKDSDFIALSGDADFQDIIRKFKENLDPIGNSKSVFTYPEKDLITESAAYDSVKKKFYLSSIYRRKIVWIDENGKTGNFKNEGEDGLWSVFGIKADSKRRILWVCTAAIKETKDHIKSDLGKSALLKYNIDSKKLIRKYELGNGENEHLLGDLALSPNGDIYISDSRFNSVYKLPGNSDSLEIFIGPKKFASLQGLDLSTDGKYLFVADYSLGLYKIDLKTKKVEQIKSPLDFTPLGIDGLYFYKNSLIVTQNGINPQRAVRIFLNDSLNAVIKYKILGANNPYFDEITLGVIRGNNFYYIANGQWDKFNEDGTIFPMERLKEPHILKADLNGN